MPKPLKIEIGEQFNYLTVIGEASRIRYAGKLHRRMFCRCICGEEIVVVLNHLRTGNTKSCGCISKEKAKKRQFKHGHSSQRKRSRAYISWENMKERCCNPNNNNYPYYGGRGIIICDRWLGEHGFENFLADMGERPKGTSLDRYPNKNGNYEPGNCRWATHKEQMNNTRRNVLIEYKGQRMSMAQFISMFNLVSWRVQNLCSRGILDGERIIQIIEGEG